jgi:hypothetical protein
MTRSQFIIKIRTFIAQGKVENALNELLNPCHNHDPEFLNMVILLSAQYNQLTNDNRKGILSFSEVNVEQAKIISNLLKIVDEIPEDILLQNNFAWKAQDDISKGKEVPIRTNNSPGTNEGTNYPSGTGNPIKIFISYSHHDEEYREKLEKALSPLKRLKKIEIWDDRQILAGQDWQDQINVNLQKAHIILLLISDNFIASDFCYSNELQNAIEKHQQKKALVIPVIIKPCDFSDLEFARIQALPNDAKPLSTWDNQDVAIQNVVQSIKKAINALLNTADGSIHFDLNA